MKRIKLDNSGVITRQESQVVVRRTTATPEVPSGAIEKTEKITAEFIKEMKDQLVKELAALLANARIVTAKNSVHQVDEISDKPATMTEPITIDDSVVVTEVSIGQLQKSFGEITETKITKDEDISKSIDKLRSIKKRS